MQNKISNPDEVLVKTVNEKLNIDYADNMLTSEHQYPLIISDLAIESMLEHSKIVFASKKMHNQDATEMFREEIMLRVLKSKNKDLTLDIVFPPENKFSQTMKDIILTSMTRYSSQDLEFTGDFE